MDYHELPRQQVEHTTKNESNERAGEDYYVVRHAEVRGSQIDEKDGGIESPAHGTRLRGILGRIKKGENRRG